MDFTDKRFSFEAGEYQGKRVIWIRFPYDEALKTYLRTNTNAWWEKSVEAWRVTDNRHYRELFGMQPRIVGKEVLTKIHPVNRHALQRFQEQIALKWHPQFAPQLRHTSARNRNRYALYSRIARASSYQNYRKIYARYEYFKIENQKPVRFALKVIPSNLPISYLRHALLTNI